jgi:hypothetical protein
MTGSGDVKLRDLKAIPWRIKLLITRKIELFPGYWSKESWAMAWAIAGIHSHKWGWVRRYGRLPCGCGRNPLTRRFVWYVYPCPEKHGYINNMEAEEGLVRPPLDDEDQRNQGQPEGDEVDTGSNEFEGSKPEHD